MLLRFQSRLGTNMLRIGQSTSSKRLFGPNLVKRIARLLYGIGRELLQLGSTPVPPLSGQEVNVADEHGWAEVSLTEKISRKCIRKQR